MECTPNYLLVDHYVRTANDQAFFDEWYAEERAVQFKALWARRVEKTATVALRVKEPVDPVSEWLKRPVRRVLCVPRGAGPWTSSSDAICAAFDAWVKLDIYLEEG